VADSKELIWARSAQAGRSEEGPEKARSLGQSQSLSGAPQSLAGDWGSFSPPRQLLRGGSGPAPRCGYAGFGSPGSGGRDPSPLAPTTRGGEFQFPAPGGRIHHCSWLEAGRRVPRGSQAAGNVGRAGRAAAGGGKPGARGDGGRRAVGVAVSRDPRRGRVSRTN
jgi:hypothetical protein